MTGQELMQMVKDKIDQTFTEDEMNLMGIFELIEVFDRDRPLHDALECAYAIEDQYQAVKAGLLPHW